MNFELVIDSDHFALTLPDAVREKISKGGRLFNIHAVSIITSRTNAAETVTSRQAHVNFAIHRAGQDTFPVPFNVTLGMMAGDALDLARKLAEAVEKSDKI